MFHGYAIGGSNAKAIRLFKFVSDIKSAFLVLWGRSVLDSEASRLGFIRHFVFCDGELWRAKEGGSASGGDGAGPSRTQSRTIEQGLAEVFMAMGGANGGEAFRC